MSVFRNYNYYYQRVTLYLILMFVFVSATTGQNVRFDFDSKNNNLLKAELEVTEKKFCNSQTTSFSVPNSTGAKKGQHSEKLGELQLQLKMSVTNTSSQPIIFDKNSFRVARKTVSESIDGKNSENIVSDFAEYITPSFNNSDVMLPEKTLFVTLQPNSTYIREIKDLVLFNDKSSKKLIKGVFIQYEILTWIGQKKMGEALREKWKQFGLLWLNSIIIDSTLLKIDRKEVLQKCIQ